MMLFKLVDQICTNIDGLSLTSEAPGLEQQILVGAAEAIDQLIEDSRRYGSEPTREAAASVLALSAFGYIKGIPSLARQMVLKVQDPNVPAARRCGLATVLAYLAQPHDLIPDEAAGGYGFLDDAILLRAGLVAYLGSLPEPGSSIEVESRIVIFLTKLTPKQVRMPLQNSVALLSHGVQVMSQLDVPMAAFMLNQIIANPLDAPTPLVPEGFTPRSVPDYAHARWSGGANFDGSNMMVPGGPASIEEEPPFIP